MDTPDAPGLPPPKPHLTPAQKERWAEFASWPTVRHLHYPIFERVIDLEAYEAYLHRALHKTVTETKQSPATLAKVLHGIKDRLTDITSSFTGTAISPIRSLPAANTKKGDGVDRLLSG